MTAEALADDTCLPCFFDVDSYDTIESAQLKRHNDDCGKVIYRSSADGR